MSESEAKTFFDIHMHVMDLSHPNILAFVRRIDGLGWKMILGGIFEPLMKKKEEKILNLLTVMENSIEDYFILLEYYLKHKANVINSNNTFVVDGEGYGRIVLTPLLMDFGYKHIKTDTFYNIPPQKPIVEQTRDALGAIAKYCRWELAVNSSGTPENKERDPNIPRLFEIYPFLGINTENYTLAKMQAMLTRYFGNYAGTRRALNAGMGTFPMGKGMTMDDVGSNVFAGIKLYPPLGFDPWPVDHDERNKVEWLYGFCEEKTIPVTVHCSDGGFAVDGKAKEYTSPETWGAVLAKFPQLYINFAHFGSQGKILGIIPEHGWREKIIELMLRYPNVYTDFSCLAFDDSYYASLARLLDRYSGKELTRLRERILFGSDFMINLMWSPSYNTYLDTFFRTGRLDKETKENFCSVNPERFLFRSGVSRQK